MSDFVTNTDAPPYPSSCPCPMQSCPKNVHTGPLIGSKTSKGPVQSSLPVANQAQTTASHLNTTTMATVASSIIDGSSVASSSTILPVTTCKREAIDPVSPIIIVKPESITPPATSINAKLAHAPPHPNYSLNAKCLEPPAMSISPARGSAGLPMPQPQQDGASQPVETPVVRRARLGKSMAREMMLLSQQHPQPQPPAQQLHVMHTQMMVYPKHTDTSTRQTDLLDIVKIESTEKLIKKEDMKEEEPDEDVVCLDKCDTINLLDARSDIADDEEMPQQDQSSHNNNNQYRSITESSINKRKFSDDEIIDVDALTPIDLTSPTSLAIKKPKILEFKNPAVKKSPPNSYKSLIKPSEPKPYLCNSDRTTPRKYFRLIRGAPRYGIQQRKIIINGKHKNLLVTPNRQMKQPKLIKKKATLTPTPIAKVEPISKASLPTAVVAPLPSTPEEPRTFEILDVECTPSTEATARLSDENISTATDDKTDEKARFMSSLELSIDRVAKGYSSDQEARRGNAKHSKLMAKIKAAEGRSKSESKKEATVVTSAKVVRDRSKSASKSRDRKNVKTVDTPAKPSSPKKTDDLELVKKSPKKVKTKPVTVQLHIEEVIAEVEVSDTNTTAVVSEECQPAESDRVALLTNETTTNNYNYNNNNNNDEDVDDHHYKDQSYYQQQHHLHTKAATNKKTKSRGAKFSNKKRHRPRQMPEIEEIIAPRKSTAAPRWCNGWRWQGPAVQGKVFLNVSVLMNVKRTYIVAHFKWELRLTFSF